MTVYVLIRLIVFHGRAVWIIRHEKFVRYKDPGTSSGFFHSFLDMIYAGKNLQLVTATFLYRSSSSATLNNRF